MRIALDVMGGDHAPHATLAGAIGALDSLADDDELILVGDETVIGRTLETEGISDDRLRIVGSSNEIEMDESPVEAVRSKPESSIVQLANMAGRKADTPVDVIISAGNTGACVSAAQMFLRRLPGVHRPGIAVTVPTFGGPVVLCDVGANPVPRALHLWQYGIMADLYAREELGVKNPRVAVLNIGGEEAKGTGMVKETRNLLRDTPGINYVGYIEGRDLFNHAADVVVTDGFVGNVVLKLSEGLAAALFKAIGREIASFDLELAKKYEPIVRSIYAKHDYHEFGGAPLLGVNGVCVICHGSSEARTITNAIRNSRKMVSHGLNQAIVERLAEIEQEAPTNEG
ncbi:MAG: phosphate acyltransferase PlsX [Phycisphaerales bacterium]